MPWQIHHAKLEDWARSYTGPRFHAVLCDPPYDYEFMGKEWDRGANFRGWGDALAKLLLPGGIAFMFGGTRTWHRLACGMEDAGFQMWDTLMWLYGSGFPKAQDVGKLSENDVWNGFKTCAIKPAWEPILAFRLPTGGTYAENALQYGSGALNVDAGRIGADTSEMEGRSGKSTRGVYEGNLGLDEMWRPNTSGRYPANLMLDEESAELLDRQTGVLTSGANPTQRHSDKTRGVYGKFEGHECIAYRGADSGGASRFFYCAKANRKERNAGLADFEKRMLRWSKGEKNPGSFQREGTDRYANNFHPTVKPIALGKWLASLLLPPASVSPRRLLVPFAGSGSEIIGALQAGWDEVVGIEMTADYIPILQSRVEHWTKEPLSIETPVESEPETEAVSDNPLQQSLTFAVSCD